MNLLIHIDEQSKVCLSSETCLGLRNHGNSQTFCFPNKSQVIAPERPGLFLRVNIDYEFTRR